VKINPKTVERRRAYNLDPTSRSAKGEKVPTGKGMQGWEERNGEKIQGRAGSGKSMKKRTNFVE